MGIFNKISQSSQNVLNKAKDLSEITSIKSKISDEQRVLLNNLAQLGELYYQNNKENPDENLKQLCGIITENKNKINELNKEIEKLKNSSLCPQCGSKLNEGAVFCGKCGMSLATNEKKFCSSCGKQLEPNCKFCPNCGAEN